MQKLAIVLTAHVLIVLSVSSSAWSRQISDDSDLMKRMYSYASQLQLKRPMYDFGLGKRSLEEAASYEDLSSIPVDAYNVEDKRAAGPNSMYSFGLGKRNRAYGFGLGKRLEAQWKYPSARQERRSKIYSFGLGKRSAVGPMYNGLEDYYDMSAIQAPAVAAAAADKRAAGGRQFSFGLGKRDVADASHNSTS